MPTLHTCPFCKSERIIRAGFSAPVKCIQEQIRQRLRCYDCKHRFSSNFYTMGYRLKKADPSLNSKIFYLCVNGLSNRSIARTFSISAECVRTRLIRLSQRALCFQNEMLKDIKIAESISFDGLQNYAGTHYDTNNVQQAVGADSLFIYDFNFASMNRSGYTSPWQKKRMAQIEHEFGRYNPKAIRHATGVILKRLYQKSLTSKLTLLSDEHFQYRRCITDDLKDCHFDHFTVSSKACRNFQSILFSVNHADLIIRQRLAAFTRKTISFSKTPGAMCQKYALFMVNKNYMRSQFTKKHVRRPFAHEHSPAAHLGLIQSKIRFSDIFDKRALAGEDRDLNEDWKHFWHGRVPKAYHRDLEFKRAHVRAVS